MYKHLQVQDARQPFQEQSLGSCKGHKARANCQSASDQNCKALSGTALSVLIAGLAKELFLAAVHLEAGHQLLQQGFAARPAA